MDFEYEIGYPYTEVLIKGSGIDFAKADQMAMSGNYSFRLQDRLVALFYEVLSANNRAGNTKMSMSDFSDKINHLLKKLRFKVERKDLNAAFLFAVDSGLFVREDKSIFLKEDYESEKKIARNIVKFVHRTNADKNAVNRLVLEIEKNLVYSLGEDQRKAVCDSLLENFFILIGGPGTGKTTVMKTILSAHKGLFKDLKIALVAPTGIAAQHMSESCKMPASTIQSFLGAVCEELPNGELIISSYKFNSENKSDVDLIVVDETSMCDIYTMNALFDALKDDCKIILVGDSDQLPSVGAGSVLSDLVKANFGNHHCVDRLTKTFRQKGDSPIIENAKRIREGRTDLIFNDSFSFIEKKTKDITKTIIELAAPYLYIEGECLVLSGARKNEVTGTAGINKAFQNFFGFSDEEKYFTVYGKKIHCSDQVMFSKNTKNVKNGDIGFISDISGERGSEVITVFVKGKSFKFDISSAEIQSLDLAYSITVHKSQGSEARMVIIALDKAHDSVLSRELIYTAITRSKDKIICVGQKEVLKDAVKKIGNSRNTNLMYWINSFMAA